MQREPRNSNVKPGKFFKPLDVLRYGSEDDPCFGKLYEPMNEVCRLCGDIELCGIAFSGNLKKNRENLEKEKSFLDLEEIGTNEKVLEFMKKRLQKGKLRNDILRITKKRFKITTQEFDELFKLIN